MAAFGMEPVNSTCPYCGEPIELLVDCSVRKQNYIEDCQVCCKPITVRVICDDEGFPSSRFHRRTKYNECRIFTFQPFSPIS